MCPHIMYAAYLRRGTTFAWDLRADISAPLARYTITNDESEGVIWCGYVPLETSCWESGRFNLRFFDSWLSWPGILKRFILILSLTRTILRQNFLSSFVVVEIHLTYVCYRPWWISRTWSVFQLLVHDTTKTLTHIASGYDDDSDSHPSTSNDDWVVPITSRDG